MASKTHDTIQRMITEEIVRLVKIKYHALEERDWIDSIDKSLKKKVEELLTRELIHTSRHEKKNTCGLER